MRGRPKCPVEVDAGEKVLAWSQTDRGPVAGTARALYLPGVGRLPWEEVESASWDQDAATWQVSPVGRWGETRTVHAFVLEDATRFLSLARERITASVVLQRFETVGTSRGFKVVARRAPVGAATPTLFVEYDAGVDPEDPRVRDRVDGAVEAMRQDLGLA